MRSYDIAILEVVGIRSFVPAVENIDVRRKLIGADGGKEFTIVLQDKDAFVRCCCFTEYGKMAQVAAVGPGAAKNAAVGAFEGVEKLDAGVAGDPQALQFQQHFSATITPLRKADDAHSVVSEQYRDRA